MVGRVVPEVLIWFGEALYVEARANHRVAATRQLAKESVGVGRIPGEANRGLGADVPGVILMATGDVSRVHVSGKRTRFKEIADAGGAIYGRRRSAMVRLGQIVIVAREIPSQAVIDSKVRSHSLRILAVQAPAFLQLVQVISRPCRGGVLTAFGIVGETAADWPHASHSSYQSGIQSLRIPAIRWIQIEASKIGVQLLKRWVSGIQTETNVINSIGRVPIMILFTIVVESKCDGMVAVGPSRIVDGIDKRIVGGNRKRKGLLRVPVGPAYLWGIGGRGPDWLGADTVPVGVVIVATAELVSDIGRQRPGEADRRDVIVGVVAAGLVGKSTPW